MKADHHHKPTVPQGWLRVLLFCVFYFSLLLGAGFLLIYLQKYIPASHTGKAGPSPEFYLSFVVNALVSLAAVAIFRKMIDRRSFNSIGFALQHQGIPAGTGFFLGIFLLCSGSCLLYFLHSLRWTDIQFNPNELFIGLGLMLIISFYEEIVFRGYILNNLLDSMRRWPALLISALIFALAHAANPDFSIIAAINILLAGILLGINYIYTRNLWFGIMLHFTWNFLQGPILGYEVSGQQLHSLLQHILQGNELITGGRFGFEGSLIATALCLPAILILLWVYERKYLPSAAKDRGI